ncbi:MAG: hypothetical protein U5L96_18345 [Owenweeksia sp.]|nr:hypothetical protein [Owenweeksia sp.]
MDRLKLPLFIISMLGLAVSCNQKIHPHQKKLAELDSLQTVVQGYKRQLDSISTERVSKLAVHVDTQYQYIVDHYSDSADREFWLNEVLYFGGIRKAMNRLEENKDGLAKEINLTAQQLQTLENSIRDEKLKDEKLEEYFTEEVQAFQRLKFQMSKSVDGAERALVIWDSLGTRYDSIANSLRN